MANKNNKAEKQKKQQGSLSKYALYLVLIVVAGYFVFTYFIKKDDVSEFKYSTDRTEQFKNIREPQFKKEGELEFLNKDNNPIKKIDVELAENNDERAQGMMYRKSMDDTRGMLFIFQNEEAQEFWMKNTIIPLDIMYVNSKNEIVRIYKNTTPLSEKPLPSEKPTLFVVEVRGGFTDKYGIKEGDLIKFSKM